MTATRSRSCEGRTLDHLVNLRAQIKELRDDGGTADGAPKVKRYGRGRRGPIYPKLWFIAIASCLCAIGTDQI